MNIPELLFRFALASPPVAHTRIAAALVHKRQVLAFGRNQYKTHPLQAQYGKNEQSIYLHAEIDAIARAWGNLEGEPLRRGSRRGTVLYILRIKRESSRGKYVLGLAKPCIGCMRAIIAFGIDRVCYSTNERSMVWL